MSAVISLQGIPMNQIPIEFLPSFYFNFAGHSSAHYDLFQEPNVRTVFDAISQIGSYARAWLKKQRITAETQYTDTEQKLHDIFVWPTSSTNQNVINDSEEIKSSSFMRGAPPHRNLLSPLSGYLPSEDNLRNYGNNTSCSELSSPQQDTSFLNQHIEANSHHPRLGLRNCSCLGRFVIISEAGAVFCPSFIIAPDNSTLVSDDLPHIHIGAGARVFGGLNLCSFCFPTFFVLHYVSC
jgi:hypothetical protein